MSILFIGNSFTYGALASAQTFHPEMVTDLNGTGIGGVPALFKAFTVQVGLDYAVSLETQRGSNLDFHFNNRKALIDKPWDNVVMHGQSNLDFAAPNDPTKISTYTALLGAMFEAQESAREHRPHGHLGARRPDPTLTPSPLAGAADLEDGVRRARRLHVCEASRTQAWWTS